MSKKKNKFKRSKKSQVHSQVSAPVLNNATPSEANATEAVVQPVAEPEDFYKTNQYAHVQRDIKIVLTLLAGIIILVFAIYYIGLKTTYLTTFGNWLYRILNIQTL